jgi:NADH dehydrogenase FAD-containing subunit
MGQHLVLIGGGHAHMETLANLHRFIDKGHKATVIQPSEHHYYSGMGPGMLGKTYRPEEIRFATRLVVQKQGGIFVLGSATHIDPDEKIVYLASGERIGFDVLSINAGSYVPQTNIIGAAENIFSVKPIEKLMEAQKRIIALISVKQAGVAIVGGGPSAAEIAGNIWQLATLQGGNPTGIRILSGSDFMGGFPDRVRKLAQKFLKQRGIEIMENDYVREVSAGQITTVSGKIHRADMIFMALGVKPSPIFEQSGLPVGPDGGMEVNQYLQCTAYPGIFGGGDCIYFRDQPLDKVGVYAVRQNPVLFHNLMASLEEEDLQAFDPGGNYLLIFNMGGGRGILHKSGFTLDGRLAFVIKDYIDRKFMKKFQALE